MPLTSAEQFHAWSAFKRTCAALPDFTTAQIFELRELLALELRRRQQSFLAELERQKSKRETRDKGDAANG